MRKISIQPKLEQISKIFERFTKFRYFGISKIMQLWLNKTLIFQVDIRNYNIFLTTPFPICG